jgi:hypothetical protein
MVSTCEWTRGRMVTQKRPETGTGEMQHPYPVRPFAKRRRRRPRIAGSQRPPAIPGIGAQLFFWK